MCVVPNATPSNMRVMGCMRRSCCEPQLDSKTRRTLSTICLRSGLLLPSRLLHTAHARLHHHHHQLHPQTAAQTLQIACCGRPPSSRTWWRVKSSPHPTSTAPPKPATLVTQTDPSQYTRAAHAFSACVCSSSITAHLLVQCQLLVQQLPWPSLLPAQPARPNGGPTHNQVSKHPFPPPITTHMQQPTDALSHSRSGIEGPCSRATTQLAKRLAHTWCTHDCSRQRTCPAPTSLALVTAHQLFALSVSSGTNATSTIEIQPPARPAACNHRRASHSWSAVHMLPAT